MTGELASPIVRLLFAGEDEMDLLRAGRRRGGPIKSLVDQAATLLKPPLRPFAPLRTNAPMILLARAGLKTHFQLCIFHKCNFHCYCASRLELGVGQRLSKDKNSSIIFCI